LRKRYLMKLTNVVVPRPALVRNHMIDFRSPAARFCSTAKLELAAPCLTVTAGAWAPAVGGLWNLARNTFVHIELSAAPERRLKHALARLGVGGRWGFAPLAEAGQRGAAREITKNVTLVAVYSRLPTRAREEWSPAGIVGSGQHQGRAGYDHCWPGLPGARLSGKDLPPLSSAAEPAAGQALFGPQSTHGWVTLDIGGSPRSRPSLPRMCVRLRQAALRTTEPKRPTGAFPPTRDFFFFALVESAAVGVAKPKTREPSSETKRENPALSGRPSNPRSTTNPLKPAAPSSVNNNARLKPRRAPGFRFMALMFLPNGRDPSARSVNVRAGGCPLLGRSANLGMAP